MGERICARAGCDRAADTRGYCGPDYRYRLHTGRYGYRDAAPARGHVVALRALGWTHEQIAEAAGTSTWVPHKLTTGATRYLLAESEAAILAVPLMPRASHRGVDGTGTYRRLEALQWMGWTLTEIAGRVGLRPHTLTTLRSRGEMVSHRVALAMAAVYEQLSHQPGPSRMTATKARRRGYAPPLAWDTDTIGNPAARPRGVRRELVSASA